MAFSLIMSMIEAWHLELPVAVARALVQLQKVTIALRTHTSVDKQVQA